MKKTCQLRWQVFLCPPLPHRHPALRAAKLWNKTHCDWILLTRRAPQPHPDIDDCSSARYYAHDYLLSLQGSASACATARGVSQLANTCQLRSAAELTTNTNTCCCSRARPDMPGCCATPPAGPADPGTAPARCPTDCQFESNRPTGPWLQTRSSVHPQSASVYQATAQLAAEDVFPVLLNAPVWSRSLHWLRPTDCCATACGCCEARYQTASIARPRRPCTLDSPRIACRSSCATTGYAIHCPFILYLHRTLPVSSEAAIEVTNPQNRQQSAHHYLNGQANQIAVTKGLVCSSCGIGLRGISKTQGVTGV